MARIWKEPYDPTRHSNPMAHEGGLPGRTCHDRDPLIPQWVYFVAVCTFVFEFHSYEQIQAAHAYYSRKILSSNRISYKDMGGGDHWEFLRWWERLPLFLREEPKRLKVVAALERALEEWSSDPRPPVEC